MNKKWSDGLWPQAEVVWALLIRETRTRFGQHHLGYLWAFIEPMLFCAVFVIMAYLINRGAPYGMDMVSFIVTGLITYKIFREATSRSASAIGGNKSLLFYPQVMTLDLVIARSVLELATGIVVLTVLLTANGLLQGSLQVDSLLVTLMGMVCASLLGASVGLVFSSLSIYSNAVDRITGPLMRPLFWISGIFFTANELPSNVRDLLLWNPLLHCIEMIRTGFYPLYDSHHLDVGYLAGWILGLTFFGVVLERVSRRRLELAG